EAKHVVRRGEDVLRRVLGEPVPDVEGVALALPDLLLDDVAQRRAETRVLRRRRREARPSVRRGRDAPVRHVADEGKLRREGREVAFEVLLLLAGEARCGRGFGWHGCWHRME